MKFHPLQANRESIDRLSEIFQATMEKRGILPKNPWKAKRLADWLAKMGGKFHPGNHRYRNYRVDTANYVNFMVDCPFVRNQPRIKGYRGPWYVCIEIPWELADKVLTLGCLP